MALLSSIATTFLALLHVYIMVLEMFLWTTPRGRKTFKLAAEFAQQTKTLAANQGLYNGFLAAGLVWGLLHPVYEFAVQIRLFFSSLVVVAGLYGGATAARKIWVVQMLPGIICLVTIYLDL
ncbi:hypothetical protein VFPPC_17628 [Pochonia chlamydosporia 170]|uniref:Integral membrane protein n=1 Tax=Pochonia chlamydosporia 170 TaxID=1380566 RepID=A0A219AR11_METCM|nr:hypothetical protein VFPPC_17628 [Pochonia chlamydosporia 170]OWT43196.1 hypothetical protein VFPPC_17628 [Pochonia chlamydosporia 170]